MLFERLRAFSGMRFSPQRTTDILSNRFSGNEGTTSGVGIAWSVVQEVEERRIRVEINRSRGGSIYDGMNEGDGATGIAAFVVLLCKEELGWRQGLISATTAELSASIAGECGTGKE